MVSVQSRRLSDDKVLQLSVKQGGSGICPEAFLQHCCAANSVTAAVFELVHRSKRMFEDAGPADVTVEFSKNTDVSVNWDPAVLMS